MITRVFCVRDTVVGACHPPFVSATEGAALRALKSAMARPGSPYAESPGDYVVFEIGTFDEVAGTLVAGEPRSICSLASLIQTGD